MPLSYNLFFELSENDEIQHIYSPDIGFKDFFTEELRGPINNRKIDLIRLRVKQYIQELESTNKIVTYPKEKSIWSYIEKKKNGIFIEIEVDHKLKKGIWEKSTVGIGFGARILGAILMGIAYILALASSKSAQSKFDKYSFLVLTTFSVIASFIFTLLYFIYTKTLAHTKQVGRYFDNLSKENDVIDNTPVIDRSPAESSCSVSKILAGLGLGVAGLFDTGSLAFVTYQGIHTLGNEAKSNGYDLIPNSVITGSAAILALITTFSIGGLDASFVIQVLQDMNNNSYNSKSNIQKNRESRGDHVSSPLLLSSS